MSSKNEDYVSRETLLREKAHQYFLLLEKWNQAHSLVQSNSLKDFFERHFNDSTQLLPFIYESNPTIIDVGSGAGFPAIPLAIYGHDVTASEINNKKLSFLKYCRFELSLQNLSIFEGDIYSQKKSFDIVTARAFSALENLLIIQKNVSRETTRGLYLKGKSYVSEMEKASKKWHFDVKIHPSQTSPEGVILEITNLKTK